MLPQISSALKVAQSAVSANSPAILTGIGVAGTISTAALTARAAFRVGLDVNAGFYEPIMDGLEPELYDAKKLVKTYWKEFIPAALSGASTIAAILGANHIHNQRGAAVAAAYSLTERAYAEYKDKVHEVLGENKERKIRDSIAQDRVTENPVSSNQVVVTGNGGVLCYESMTGRYFKSTVEHLRKAQNDLNQEIITQMYASQNDYFDAIGLPHVANGDNIGWNVASMLELQFSAVLSEDQEPCICVGYTFLPVADYYKIG